jgi:Zn-dependent protease with chaperone function
LLFTKNRIIWCEFPEFHVLAQTMNVKLHPKKPFGIKPNFKNAYANPSTRQIVFGKPILDFLTANEQKALAAHELTHLQKHHGPKSLAIPFLLFVMFFVFMSFLQLSSPLFVILVLFVAPCITLIIVKRHYEFKADIGAAIFTDPRLTISFLSKLLNHLEKKDLDTIFHPSLEQRINNVHKAFPNSSNKDVSTKS